MNIAEIHLAKDLEHVPLIAADFGSRAILRALAGDAELKLYATLRTLGHDCMAAFSASLAESFVAHPATIMDALEVLDGAAWFQTLQNEIVATFEPRALLGHYAACIASWGASAHDAAMHVRLSAKPLKSIALRSDIESERAQCSRIMSERAHRRNEQDSLTRRFDASQNDALAALAADAK